MVFLSFVAFLRFVGFSNSYRSILAPPGSGKGWEGPWICPGMKHIPPRAPKSAGASPGAPLQHLPPKLTPQGFAASHPRRQKLIFPAQKLIFPAQTQSFPSQKLIFPAQKWSFPAQKWSFPGQKLIFPAQKWRFPSQKLSFPAQNRSFPVHFPPFQGE